MLSRENQCCLQILPFLHLCHVRAGPVESTESEIDSPSSEWCSFTSFQKWWLWTNPRWSILVTTRSDAALIYSARSRIASGTGIPTLVSSSSLLPSVSVHMAHVAQLVQSPRAFHCIHFACVHKFIGMCPVYHSQLSLNIWPICFGIYKWSGENKRMIGGRYSTTALVVAPSSSGLINWRVTCLRFWNSRRAVTTYGRLENATGRSIPFQKHFSAPTLSPSYCKGNWWRSGMAACRTNHM